MTSLISAPRLTHSDVRRACGAGPNDKEMQCPCCHHQHLQLFDEDGIKCQNGCATSDVVGKIREVISTGKTLPKSANTKPPADRPSGKLTLSEYGITKNLYVQPLEQHFGLYEGPHPYYSEIEVCVHEPYFDENGALINEQCRWGMGKGQRRYLANKPTYIYAGHFLQYLEDRAKAGDGVESINLYEGESNTQTAALNNLPALGLPGVRNWRPEWAKLKLFEAADCINFWYDMREDGTPEDVAKEGGRKVAESFPPGKVLGVKLPAPFKDISQLWLFHTTDAFGEGIEGFQRELRRAIRSAQPIIQPRASVVVPANIWPEPMRADAFYGLAGDFVRLVEPETEADPVALLGNFLIAAGVLFGREAWAVADGKKHYPIEYLLMVGPTGAGRKGTATERVLPVMDRVEEGFRNHVLSGLSSGEGLIKGISPKEGESKNEVRRFLVQLPEFASLLGVMKREGNTLSAILREAWDGGRLRVLTRKEPLDVDNVNLSAIVHITPSELVSGLSETEKANGFANRHLPILVHRSKLLPEGGKEVNPNEIVQRLQNAVEQARGRGCIQRDADARNLWAAEYPNLAKERIGLRGALCSRAEAHVLRLSLLYALLDGVPEIRVPHLRAALAFWAYCENCIEHLFGGSTGDPEADKILRALENGPATLSELHHVFNNNKTAEWLLAKLADMERSNLIRQTTKQGSRKEALQAWEKVNRS
jgi:hypothetical protein